MSFRATLKFNQKEYDVLECTYNLKRDVDSKGRPASNIYGGLIKVRIESTDDTQILENMINQFKPVQGSVTFNKDDEEAKLKELIWENGYVVDFEESINVVGATQMEIRFTISAQIIKMGGAQFEQNWPK